MWKAKFLKWAYYSLSYLPYSFKRFSKRLLFKATIFQKHMLIKIDGMPFYIRLTPASINEYLLQPYEPYTTELFKKAVKPGAIVLDIGAQFGYYSLLAAKLTGPRGQIFSFEPVPSNFEVLRKNIQLNRFTNVIKPINKAIGDKRGMATIFIYKDSDSHGMFRHPSAPIKEVISVESITIDEFLEGRLVDVIKMDIEGNEPYAIKGMTETISKNSNLILFAELTPTFLRKAGAQVDDYLTQLKEFGFEIQVIDEQAYCLKPLHEIHIKEDDPTWHVNLYCRKGKI